VQDAIERLYTPIRTLLVYPGDQPLPGLDEIRTLAVPALKRDLSIDPAFALSDAYHGLLAVAGVVHARSSAVLVSGIETLTPLWIYQLIRPVLELDFDLVTPSYSHPRFAGMVNTGIVAPLTRALYGRQIEHPLGPDFAFSGKFAGHLLSKHSKRHPRSLASISIDAICDGFEVCQSHVGERTYPPVDWMNQSSVLTQILRPVFQEAEQHAQQWQRVRGSRPVPYFGDEAQLQDDPQPIDIQKMIDSFRLGQRNLQEIWQLVLPPGTLLELSRLARMPAETFRLPDRLWAHILFDFALGYRLHTISQDHLLRAMTPLYLAWAASYMIEMGRADSAGLHRRNDQLGLALEAAKPYVLSRWRWPDRFNP
jgi:hypothetical protein